MTTRVIIIHGSFGHPDENWFPWLRDKLEKNGIEVVIPQFPTPDDQSLYSWKEILKTSTSKILTNDILVGHSTGAALVLRILEELNAPLKAAFLVSGFGSQLGNPLFDRINQSFFDKPFHWESIRGNAERFFLYHGDNDPYVPTHFAQTLSRHLNSELVMIENGGHLNTESGFVTFEKLLEDLAPLL